MGTNDAVETHGQSVLRRFESYGACKLFAETVSVILSGLAQDTHGDGTR